MFYTRAMKPLYILKIGGSVATYKNRPGISVRKSLLKKIAQSIKYAQNKGKFNLIVIHGAGAGGHQLAKKYKLEKGAGNDKKKWHGALISRITNQALNNSIVEIFVKEGLRAVSANTASVVIQKNGHIEDVNLGIIKEALSQNCIPILYGEMVFDKKLGMTICSGDAIAPYLADKLKAQKMFFASDINGIFDKDPHIYKDAKLIEKINLGDIKKNIKLSKSHNVDVTDGLSGKIKNLEKLKSSHTELIEIFNGLFEKNYGKVFLERKFIHTRISLKK
jgi:isopentenyl phosphate kinase